MRSVYWAFISETKQRLQAENPTLSKTMVLEMARTECLPKFPAAPTQLTGLVVMLIQT